MLRTLFEIKQFHLGPIPIGPITLHSYGAMLVVAFIVGIFLARSRAPRFGLKPEQISDAAFWALLAGILGARVVFIAEEWKYYSQHTSEIFKLQFDGLTSFGGFIFGGLALWAFARTKKMSLGAIFDACGGPFLISHAIGRVGCLLNGCCHGRTCTDAWCIQMGPEVLRYHPAQLYDSVFNIVAFALLVWWERRGTLKSGQSFGIAIGLHGLARFLYEFWRAGTVEEVREHIASSTRIAGTWITEAQVAALVILAIGALIYWRSRGQYPLSTSGEGEGGGESVGATLPPPTIDDEIESTGDQE